MKHIFKTVFVEKSKFSRMFVDNQYIFFEENKNSEQIKKFAISPRFPPKMCVLSSNEQFWIFWFFTKILLISRKIQIFWNMFIVKCSQESKNTI